MSIARIPLTLFCHSSLSVIPLGKSSKRHPVFVQSGCNFFLVSYSLAEFPTANCSIVKIGQNTEKSQRDLRGVAVVEKIPSANDGLTNSLEI